MIISLKYEIPKRAGQCQIAVHPFILDETTRSFDSLALVLQCGFMISTKWHRPATDTRYRSAVTRVSLESFSIQVRYSNVRRYRLQNNERLTLYKMLSLISSAMTVVPACSSLRVTLFCIALSNSRKPCFIPSTISPALYSLLLIIYS